ncbi:inner membrane protein YhjD [Morganella morganii]|uniref:inner membrane protein YhjD n=1 Tax=Morganella morganii TaxID=582 RepID=UPI001419EDB5|nr:inner membrane protein YhjD [Morganella morganii]NIH17056.1 inner membrane protein YhjD [Morganella morganii]
MTREHDTPEDDNSTSSLKPLRKNFDEGIKQGKKALKWSVKAGNYIRNIPFIAHLIRTATRFNDRMGSPFGAAITYFSFLSMIPILMVSFAAAGYVLAFNPELLTRLIRGVANSISDPTLAGTIERSIDTAIRQRATVGLTGLALALYSGVNWVGNLRMAIRAQYHDQWEPDIEVKENMFLRYLRDFLALIGLLVALVVTLSLTSIAGAAQARIVAFLGLDAIEWLRPAWTAIGLTISILANYLLFTWILWILPRMKLNRKSLLKGTLLAAVGFEILKTIMTWLLPNMAASPSGAAFGSVIGLMAFFYFFARLILFSAAWIATDIQKNKTA